MPTHGTIDSGTEEISLTKHIHTKLSGSDRAESGGHLLEGKAGNVGALAGAHQGGGRGSLWTPWSPFVQAAISEDSSSAGTKAFLSLAILPSCS